MRTAVVLGIKAAPHSGAQILLHRRKIIVIN
jgi:hypothetical protein